MSVHSQQPHSFLVGCAARLPDLVREEPPEEVGIDAVRLLDPATDEVVAAAGEHLDPVLGGDLGERIRQLDPVIAREVVALDAGLVCQRLGVPQHLAVEDR